MIPLSPLTPRRRNSPGNYKNNGKAWQAKGSNAVVNAYDFGDKDEHGNLKKVVPYGVYDSIHNAGYVNVGTSADTAAFSGESIRRWWHDYGHALYPDKTDLLITCDGGGSNSSRSRLWKKEIQQLANETQLSITIRHYPPATSKWNKIEHRMFCHITQNWRGRPLVSHDVVINLIANTTTKAGLKLQAELDEGTYPTGIKVSDRELSAVNLKRAKFHGEWNYTLLPTRKNR